VKNVDEGRKGTYQLDLGIIDHGNRQMISYFCYFLSSQDLFMYSCNILVHHFPHITFSGLHFLKESGVQNNEAITCLHLRGDEKLELHNAATNNLTTLSYYC